VGPDGCADVTGCVDHQDVFLTSGRVGTQTAEREGPDHWHRSC
jgi:hypothetical protein